MFLDFHIFKASDNLSKLELKIITDNMSMEVLWFRVMKNMGQWKINRHRHSSVEFHFVASGGCKVILDHGEFYTEAGDMYITAPGVYHSQVSSEENDYMEYSLNCDMKVLSDSVSEEKHIIDILNMKKCVCYNNIEHILKHFETALSEAYYKELGFYNKIKNVVQIIILESARVIGKSSEISYETPMKLKKYDYRLKQIESYIKDNLNTSISTKDVANYMHLSDKQICRIISQGKGISTKEYINSLKFLKAKKLLINTEYSISEISDILGFSSQYYFNQFFKKREGYSPSVFRKNVRNV